MALTVENDTGLSAADSYVTLVAFKAYCTGRNIDFTELGDGDDTSLEALLRTGFLYVNSQYAYKSTPISNDQSGEFPRVDLSDGMGRIFNVVPKRAKDAQCEAAIAAGQGHDLFVIAERGGQVASEAVGPISTSYQAGAPAITLFQAIERLLAPFVRDPNCPRRPLPSFNDYSAEGKECPIFSVGMDDNPEGGSTTDPGLDF